jgi:hypothetical protein
MRLVDDPEIAEWVEALTGAEAFEWDRGRPIRCGRVHPARRETMPDQLPRDAAQGEGDV